MYKTFRDEVLQDMEQNLDRERVGIGMVVLGWEAGVVAFQSVSPDREKDTQRSEGLPM
jgi:hypothetical protein